jgi:Phosphoesterase family/Divergent InlB B-repeat domain
MGRFAPRSAPMAPLFAVCTALIVVFLTGCGGIVAGSSPSSPSQPQPQPQSQSFTLTVTVSGSGSITSSPAGINCGSSCRSSFGPNTLVKLTATPSASSIFKGWSGSCAGTGSCAIDIKQNSSVTATFATSDSLSVTVSGTGGGTIVSSPQGINCSTTCSAVFSSGTQVTLTEIAGSNSVFAGWSGACSGTGACQVTVGKIPAAVGASFTATAYTLTVTLPGNGTGTVSSSPTGITCNGTACGGLFSPGTQVTLTASPSANSYLVAWSAPCSGTGTCAVTLTSNVTLSSTINVWPINHIIFMAQENRSLDHYFGAMRAYWAANGIPDQSFDGLPQFNPVQGIPPLYGPPPTNPGCDPNGTSGLPFSDCVVDSNSPTITSFHLLTQCVEGTGVGWDSDHYDLDWSNPYADPQSTPPPPMDGYVSYTAHGARVSKYYDTAGMRTMGYYDWTDLNYYYFMATDFATSDRFFNPVMSRTHPNRAYLAAATSQGETAAVGSSPNDPELTALTIYQDHTGRHQLENLRESCVHTVHPTV